MAADHRAASCPVAWNSRLPSMGHPEEGLDMENAGSERMDFVTSDMSRRIAAWCAIVGGGLGLIATLFHPRDFVAYDSAAHLKTIAENATWTVDHFAFVVATFLILWGLIATVDVLAKTPGALLAK